MKSSWCQPILLCLIVHIASAQVTGLRRELNELIRYETNIDYKDTPGFIIGMLDKDTSFIYSFGRRAMEDESMIEKQDIFELGGATKLCTALLVELMSQDYDLDLHRSINAYLPVQNPHFDSCTLFRLLTHTSGLPKYPPGWGIKEQDNQNPYGYFNRSDLEEFFISFPLIVSPQDYLYSHLNYALIEWMLEYVSGKKYNDLIKMYVHQYFNVGTNLKPTVQGYNLNGMPVKPWTYKTFGGALGLRGSLEDLMDLCHHFLYNNNTAFRTLMKVTPTQIRKNDGWISMGWQVIPIPKNRFIHAQNGRTEGHHTFIGIIPDTHTAVVILANSATGTDLLGVSILRMMNRNWKRK